MQRLYFKSFAVILCCCPFLLAQNYKDYAEAQIVPTEAFTISDIEALPKPPAVK